MIDGTTKTLQCGIHNFETEDLTEWYKHLSEPGHYDHGRVICYICGKEAIITPEEKVPSMIAIKGRYSHKECRGGAEL